MWFPVFGKDPVYYKVDGIPAANLPTGDGGSRSVLFDGSSPGGAPVTMAYLRDSGEEICEIEFYRLRKAAAGKRSQAPA